MPKRNGRGDVKKEKQPVDYVTVQRLAAKWAVSDQTILNWIKDNRLKAVTLSKRVIRVPVSEVARFESEAGASTAA